MLKKLITYITGKIKYKKIDDTEFFRYYQKINGKVYEYTFMTNETWNLCYNGYSTLDRGPLLLRNIDGLFSMTVYAKYDKNSNGVIVDAKYEDIKNLLYSMKLVTTFEKELLLLSEDFVRCYRNILDLKILKKCPIYMIFDIKDEESLSKIQNIDPKIFKVNKDGMESKISLDKEILNIYFEVSCNNIKPLEFYNNSINNIVQIIQKRIEKI